MKAFLRPLDDLQPDGAAAELGREEVLDVAHHRGEATLQVVMVIGRVVAGAALGGGEGGELAGNGEQRDEQALRMDEARAAHVLENRDVPVEQLQDEIVGALQAAAGGRVAAVAGELLQLVVDPADDAVHPAVDHRMGRAEQHGRRELLVEQDGAVAHFEDAPERQADIAGLLVLRSSRPKRGWAMSISSSTRSEAVESINISVAG